MPIYEYRCVACGRSVEVVHPISGTGPKACDVCGGEMRKALTTPAIHFKGSGWAKKDARSAPAGPGSSTAAAGEGGSKEPGAGEAAGAAASPDGASTSTGSEATPSTTTTKPKGGTKPDAGRVRPSDPSA